MAYEVKVICKDKTWLIGTSFNLDAATAMACSVGLWKDETIVVDEMWQDGSTYRVMSRHHRREWNPPPKKEPAVPVPPKRGPFRRRRRDDGGVQAQSDD